MRRMVINRAFWVLGAVLGTVVTLVALSQDWIGFTDASSPEKPLAAGSPAWLLEKHDCWTGDAPADMEGQLPGHVVVTLDGHVAPTYGGPKLVGWAFDQVAHDHPELDWGPGKDRGLEVHGFCR